MVTFVTFSAATGGSGRTYSDGSDPETGFGNNGAQRLLMPFAADLIATGVFVKGQADAAVAAALTALNAPGTVATSTSPQTWTGASAGTDFTFTIQSGKTIVPGMDFKAARTSAPSTQAINGVVKSYSGTTLVITATSVTGTGTSITDWTLSLTQSAGIPSSRSITGGGLANGGGPLSSNQVITVTAATAAEIVAGTSTTTAITPAAYAAAFVPQPLSYASTVTWAIAKFAAELVMTGNPIIAAPTGGKKGFTYYYWLIQDGTGGRVPTLSTSAFKFEAAGVPTFSTGANKRDLVTMVCIDDTPGANVFRCVFNRAA